MPITPYTGFGGPSQPGVAQRPPMGQGPGQPPQPFYGGMGGPGGGPSAAPSMPVVGGTGIGIGGGVGGAGAAAPPINFQGGGGGFGNLSQNFGIPPAGPSTSQSMMSGEGGGPPAALQADALEAAQPGTPANQKKQPPQTSPFSSSPGQPASSTGQ